MTTFIYCQSSSKRQVRFELPDKICVYTRLQVLIIHGSIASPCRDYPNSRLFSFIQFLWHGNIHASFYKFQIPLPSCLPSVLTFVGGRWDISGLTITCALTIFGTHTSKTNIDTITYFILSYFLIWMTQNYAFIPWE